MGYEEISTEEWEERCHGCGLCCFEKIEDENGTIFYTQTPCRYLDVVTRQCKIYENRLIISPECIKLTPELVERLHWLPRQCGYISPPSSRTLPLPPHRDRRRRKRK